MITIYLIIVIVLEFNIIGLNTTCNSISHKHSETLMRVWNMCTVILLLNTKRGIDYIQHTYNNFKTLHWCRKNIFLFSKTDKVDPASRGHNGSMTVCVQWGRR